MENINELPDLPEKSETEEQKVNETEGNTGTSMADADVSMEMGNEEPVAKTEEEKGTGAEVSGEIVNEEAMAETEEGKATDAEVLEMERMPMEEPEMVLETDAPVEVSEEPMEELEPTENFGAYSKEDLTQRMEGLCRETDLNAIKNKVNQAREAFNAIVAQERATALSKHLEEGNKEEDFEHFPDEKEERFRKAYSKYSKLKADFILGQEKIREENLKIKQDILSQMKNLIQNENNMSKAFTEFHELQARWRNTGAVPQQNVNDLWLNYKLYIDRFYDFIKINRDLQVLDQKKNLEMKLHLCELAEGLIIESSLNKAIKEAQRLQNKWKEIGFVSREQSNELWARFRTALDKVYENKKQYLEEQTKKYAENYAEKIKLCEQAEVIANAVYEQHNQWQEGQKNILELQAAFQKTGAVGEAKNEEIWKRFRKISDVFFKQKDEFYKKRKQEFAANLQGKTEICIQAEGLQENSDWKATADELIRLQQEWKKFGAVGTQEKNNKLWARFKAACDVFFNRRKANFESKDNEQEENYKKKLDLISRVEKFEVNKKDTSESLEHLKAFQREWTETGLVPLKKKDGVWDKFRTAIKVHFDVLDVRPDFRAGATYSSERGSSAAKATTGDERDITNKMNKLKEEVMQLENNIEFFAKSKGPNLIKQEYEKKIQASKDEIAKLKAKLKEIRSAE